MRVLALAALLLTGCASMSGLAWYKDGSTERDFAMDNGQCKAQALAVRNGFQQTAIHKACMEGKGWVLR